MARIYISSTYEDLKEQRAEVERVLRRRGHTVVCMEDYVAREQRPVERCLEDVRHSDLYIGVFAFRYGYVPPGQADGGARSITELEYLAAGEAGKERLCFLLDKKASWSLDLVDEDRMPVSALRAQLERDHSRELFRTTEHLGRLVLEAVAEWEKRTDRQPPHLQHSPVIDVEGYARKVAERYGRIDLDALIPPERDEQFRIPLDAVFVEQSVREDRPPVELPKELWETLQQSGEIKVEDLPKGVTAEQLERARAVFRDRPSAKVFDALARTGARRAVLLGDPGAGKSTLTRFVLLSLLDNAGDARVRNAWPDALPLLVELRRFAGLRAERRCDTFIEYFDLLGRTEGLCLDAPAVTAHLASGSPTLIIFDGLDELFDPGLRETVTLQIAGFASDHPHVHVLVTSRLVGYAARVLTDAGFAHFTLQDLDATQIERFLRAWFARVLSDRPEDAALRLARIVTAVSESRSIAQLAGNPLLLTIMAIIGKNQELPRERTELYQHAVSVLVEHWDVRKHLADANLATGPIDRHEKFELLRRIAWAMQDAPGGLAGNYIHDERLMDVIDGFLRDRFDEKPAHARRISVAMVRQLRERNFILCLYGASLYGFVHRSFLEYFCATAIQYRFEKSRDLSLEELKLIYGRNWEYPEWREVLRLVAGLIEPKFAGALIDHLTVEVYTDWPRTFDDRPPRNLALAVECLGEIRNLLALDDVGERLLARLIALLEHGVGVEDDGRNALLMDEITPAVEGIAERWPGRLSARPWFFTRGPGLVWWPLTSAWCRMAGALYKSDPAVFELYGRLLTEGERRVRGAVVEALVVSYRERPETFDLLVDRVRNDPEAYVRSASVAALGSGYRERPETFDLLVDRVRNDPEADVRAQTAAALLRHGDRRLLLLASRDLDGVQPFLDPRKPFPEAHIARACQHFRLDESGISDLLNALTARVGWVR